MVLVALFAPYTVGIGGSPDLHDFYKWVFDSLEVLNDFTGQVVVSRRDTGIRKWARWLRVDFGFQAVCLAEARLRSSFTLSGG